MTCQLNLTWSLPTLDSQNFPTLPTLKVLPKCSGLWPTTWMLLRTRSTFSWLSHQWQEWQMQVPLLVLFVKRKVKYRALLALWGWTASSTTITLQATFRTRLSRSSRTLWAPVENTTTLNKLEPLSRGPQLKLPLRSFYTTASFLSTRPFRISIICHHQPTLPSMVKRLHPKSIWPKFQESLWPCLLEQKTPSLTRKILLGHTPKSSHLLECTTLWSPTSTTAHSCWPMTCRIFLRWKTLWPNMQPEGQSFRIS